MRRQGPSRHRRRSGYGPPRRRKRAAVELRTRPAHPPVQCASAECWRRGSDAARAARFVPAR
eukprot:scaffold134_cov244-Pinguiococcus_pyrenoidosus.AAC.3